MMRTGFLALFFLLLARGGFAKEVAGVTLPDTVKVGEQTLKLNGMGLRTMFFIKLKVYVVGLYLEKPSKDAAQVISSEQVKSARLTFLRSLDRGKLIAAIGEGFERNAGKQLPALKPRLEKLKEFLTDVKAGDQLEVTYVPAKGTVILVKGREKGVIEGKDFAAALFSVWLGSDPVDEDLKTALLGG